MCCDVVRHRRVVTIQISFMNINYDELTYAVTNNRTLYVGASFIFIFVLVQSEWSDSTNAIDVFHRTVVRWGNRSNFLR